MTGSPIGRKGRIGEPQAKATVLSFAASVASTLVISTVAAGTAITKLAAAGVLTQVGGGSRNRIWQAFEILDAVDAFAARARRGRT